MMKFVCANCHFFCRQYRNDAGGEYTLEVTADQRALARRGDLAWQKPSESISCHRGIWDQGVGVHQRLSDSVSKQSRRGKCYFFAYQPGMLMPAAEKLEQDRRAKAGELFKHRLVIYGLLLTILGLVMKLIYERG